MPYPVEPSAEVCVRLNTNQGWLLNMCNRGQRLRRKYRARRVEVWQRGAQQLQPGGKHYRLDTLVRRQDPVAQVVGLF